MGYDDTYMVKLTIYILGQFSAARQQLFNSEYLAK